LNIIAVVGAVTALVAAAIGLVQNDIKKVLAYSTVSQLGLMFLAIGMGAYNIAVFHVITHAFFKACLFLGSGSVIHAMGGEQDMRKMGNLRKAMPITFITMLVATLAISGIPPFAGFFSKDEILITAFHNNITLFVIASIASIMTAFYMFRLLYLTFFKSFRGSDNQKEHLHESPALITFPLIVLGILSLIGGLISLPGNSWLNRYLEPIFINVGREEHVFGNTEYLLMAVAVLGGLIGIALAYSKYIKNNSVPVADDQIAGISKVLYNKLYVDEFYTAILVTPINKLALFFKNTVEVALAQSITGLANVINSIGVAGQRVQSGSVGLYLFSFVIGVVGILIYLFLVQ
jgi:NADH-quinone oxidoreductase subunit L